MTAENIILNEVNRRKTFAIISHPDAGKTTMTEKLLLYGGAIRLAGTVKSRKAKKYAVSDWMEIEKQRGISVTSSVMNFDYNGFRINILDTPGHQDFSEDTYRTLVAADSAVMLIDGAKGVEAQTKKLFHVCRMRGIPIFTFVNKLDRSSKNPFDLMEEIEATLGIRSYPMNWPIGTDGNFKGVYNRKLSRVELFEAGNHGQSLTDSLTGDLHDERIKHIIGDELHSQLCEEVELLDIAGDEFDLEKVKAGELTPMFFGSAMTNFGIEPFLEEFLALAPSPDTRPAATVRLIPVRMRSPASYLKFRRIWIPHIGIGSLLSGSVPAVLKRHGGLEYQAGKVIRLSQPQQFFAQDREMVEEAYAGDIIGVFDPGVFNIGDTLCAGKKTFRFDNIPIFPAEHFAEVSAKDATKRKQFLKGIQQISEEGAIQVFKQPDIGVETLTIGVVGALQFEVLEFRMKNEYGVDLRIQQLPYLFARWVTADTVTKDMLGYLESADGRRGQVSKTRHPV